jgi:hypothetical protein
LYQQKHEQLAEEIEAIIQQWKEHYREKLEG